MSQPARMMAGAKNLHDDISRPVNPAWLLRFSHRPRVTSMRLKNWRSTER